MISKIQLERRTYPRYRVRVFAQITTPTFYISVNTIDISVEGIRIETYSQITPGTKVTVSFDLIKDLLFYGKVMWEMAFQKNDVLMFDIGIKIHRITFSGIKVDGFNSKEDWSAFVKDLNTRGAECLEKQTDLRNIQFIYGGSSASGYSTNPYKGKCSIPTWITR